MSFDVVVAADLEWGIGKDQSLPWPKLRGDLRHFKRITTTTSAPGRKNAIVMGRKTWQSKEVAERALPDRVNIVVSRSALAVPPGVIAARSLDEALARVRLPGPAFCIGGGELYAQALPRADHLHLTEIARDFAGDASFPAFDRSAWRETAREPRAIAGPDGFAYAYVTYERIRHR